MIRLASKPIHLDTSFLIRALAPDSPEAGKLLQILNAVESPGEGFDMEMNRKLLEQAMEIAPTALENLPVINR